jgi:2-keto-4-pentenoate hydratase
MPDRTIDDATAELLAARLRDATLSRVALPPLTAERPDLTPADAYAIQQRVVAPRLDAGETIVGWKLGLTSKAMQQQLGVDQPDYGPILSGYLTVPGGVLRTDALIAPRIEAEIAFVLGSPLRGPGVTPEAARAATKGIVPALEIIDSRIADWKITLADTIADLASSARVAIGGPIVPIGGRDVRLIGCVLERDGDVVATGAGAAALGDPAAAVAWAANTLGALGVTMEAGAIIMTGALHASIPVRAGDAFTATFDGLGSVSVRFE